MPAVEVLDLHDREVRELLHVQGPTQVRHGLVVEVRSSGLVATVQGDVEP